VIIRCVLSRYNLHDGVLTAQADATFSPIDAYPAGVTSHSAFAG
jgi:hypothetical protein